MNLLSSLAQGKTVEKGGEGRRLTEIGGVGQRSERESLTMEANIFRVGG